MRGSNELWTVARSFGEIVNEVVFVGGMIRELLITDPAAGGARPTLDVDCIVNTTSYLEYARLAERLRAYGFSECRDEDAPLCRWVVQGVRVDVMPVDPSVMGFSNVWYASALDHPMLVEGPSCTIRILDAVHFCATKIESFLGRGQGDFFHHDIEDLVAIVDARAELANELEEAPKEVREFIAAKIGSWLDDETFKRSLAGHLQGDGASQARMPILVDRLRRMASSPGRRPIPPP